MIARRSAAIKASALSRAKSVVTGARTVSASLAASLNVRQFYCYVLDLTASIGATAKLSKSATLIKRSAEITATANLQVLRIWVLNLVASLGATASSGSKNVTSTRSVGVSATASVKKNATATKAVAISAVSKLLKSITKAVATVGFTATGSATRLGKKASSAGTVKATVTGTKLAAKAKTIVVTARATVRKFTQAVSRTSDIQATAVLLKKPIRSAFASIKATVAASPKTVSKAVAARTVKAAARVSKFATRSLTTSVNVVALVRKAASQSRVATLSLVASIMNVVRLSRARALKYFTRENAFKLIAPFTLKYTTVETETVRNVYKTSDDVSIKTEPASTKVISEEPIEVTVTPEPAVIHKIQ